MLLDFILSGIIQRHICNYLCLDANVRITLEFFLKPNVKSWILLICNRYSKYSSPVFVAKYIFVFENWNGCCKRRNFTQIVTFKHHMFLLFTLRSVLHYTKGYFILFIEMTMSVLFVNIKYLMINNYLFYLMNWFCIYFSNKRTLAVLYIQINWKTVFSFIKSFAWLT